MLYAIHLGEVEVQRSALPKGLAVKTSIRSLAAIHLRFDIGRSSLAPAVKEKLLRWQDHRITKDGVIVIKAQSSRSQDQNKASLARLGELIAQASLVLPVRRPASPLALKRRRLEGKLLRSGIKSGHGKVDICM